MTYADILHDFLWAYWRGAESGFSSAEQTLLTQRSRVRAHVRETLRDVEDL